MDAKSALKSKTVWAAIIGGLLSMVGPVSSAVGHPVEVPPWIYGVLASFGLYGLRDGIGKPLAALAVMLMLGSTAWAAPYMEAGAGIAADVTELRFGNEWQNWDLSGGYQRRDDAGIKLNTLSVELDRNLLSFAGIRLFAGVGAGYTIPTVPTDVRETIDNGHSWRVRGGVSYKFSDHLGVVGTVQGLFFTEDSHRTEYEFNDETLSNGQGVTTVTPIHIDSSRNFDTIFAGIALKYWF